MADRPEGSPSTEWLEQMAAEDGPAIILREGRVFEVAVR